MSGCGQSESLKATATSQPTATSIPQTATSEPTATSIPQTATSEPTATSIPATEMPQSTEISKPGWEKFEGDGIDLWLPESFEGGNLDEDIDLVVEMMRNLGPEYEQTAQLVEQNPSIFIIWAFDSVVGGSGYLTSVAVTKEKVFSALTLDSYLDAAQKQFPSQFKVVEREILSHGENQAGRLIIEFEVNGVFGKEVVNVIETENTMWIITCATGLDEYEERSPIFEEIFQNAVIKP
jgi:hypothetical protein